ncbi:MAG: CRISPR-associated endoribonuclease Cas6 [Oscillatoriales cyanobacterium CG2_30_40_61]|nr:MAG: CRISPR-associated endoribonuclease Cas6 [Oscillatoriales cyanobacterium CG2_30_40_61]
MTKKLLYSPLNFPDTTELVAVTFQLVPETDALLIPQYTIGLHAWFLDQIRQIDPQLSQYLHDGQSEKPFTLSGLQGEIGTAGKQLQIYANQTYQWSIIALSKSMVNGLKTWLKNQPQTIDLRQVKLNIKEIKIAQTPTTYQQLFQTPITQNLALSFVSPTSFRRKGHHFPLPLPFNVFHSYLRRWNDFSQQSFDQDIFLNWVDENVIILRHQLQSLKVSAGKRGSVTGFTGVIEYRLAEEAYNQPEFVQLFSALGQFAPYCGTGHKTTFGLGQTQLGWTQPQLLETTTVEILFAQRVEQITQTLMQTQKRTGGTRAMQVCETRATILARQEFGESLKEIAEDLEMPYETVKTYAKLARQGLK